MIRAVEIAERIGTGWPVVLEQLGIAPEYLVNRHGPCPACGGRDRYRFDNKRGRGDFFCNGCGAGDGFNLLMRVNGWDFKTARDEVLRAAGLSDSGARGPAGARVEANPVVQEIAQPTQRVRRLWRESCAVVDCNDAVEYLAHRHLWPIPAACALRAHPSVEYFDGAQRLGRYAALIAQVVDISGELVTIHTTYLLHGRKLADHEPRKLLSPLTGRIGCSVRLMPIEGDTLGIGEGIETCLAASAQAGMSTWAAVNTSLLAKFEPPPMIKRLVVFADRDVAGLEAAARLMERLQGSIPFELRVPSAPHKDFNDILINQRRGEAVRDA